MKIKTLWEYFEEELVGYEINPREMADALGFDRSETFRRYKEGLSYPDFEMCYKLSKCYPIDPETLYQRVCEIKATHKELGVLKKGKRNG